MEMINLGAMVCAFLLLAQAAVRERDRRKAFFYGFLALFLFAVGGQAFSGEGFWFGLTDLTRNIGLGLIAGGLYLANKDNHPKAMLVPGVLCLALSGGLFVSIHGVQFANKALNGDSDHVQGELLVELGADDDIDELKAVLKKYKASYERAFPSLTLADDEDLAQYFQIRAEESQLEALLKDLRADKENVDQADFNYIVKLSPIEQQGEQQPGNQVSGQQSFLANDPMLKDQWGFEKTDGNELHKLLDKAKPKRKAIVAIVDTGVDGKHEDLKEVFGESSGDSDGNGHGTHCAGIAGASTNNGIGVASFNWANKFVTIRGYKALTDEGWGTTEMVAQAIIDAAKDGADVISLSLGGYSPRPPQAEVDAVEFALKKGCIVICAAGNSNQDAKLHAPANIKGVICVSALDQDMRKARFSNTNTSLDMPIAAPGVGILSLKPGTGYVPLSGTSMATPMVSGLVGVMRAMQPEMTPRQAYRVLHETGKDGADTQKIGRAIHASSALKRTMKK